MLKGPLWIDVISGADCNRPNVENEPENLPGTNKLIKM